MTLSDGGIEASGGLSLDEVARLTGGRVEGDGARRISAIAPLDEAGPEHLSFLAGPKYRREAEISRAGALLVREGLEVPGRDQVVVEDPHLALSVLIPRLHPPSAWRPGVSPDARIAPGATVGRDAGIGPFAVLAEGSRVGDRVRIGAGCYVGAGSEIDEDSVLHPNVTVYHGCRLGRRVIVHSGSVIGSDGFGYATERGIHHKVPQVGGVVIEDDVEIGASVTIDRGSIGTTLVGRGTKIDNLVQIAHNVRIGPGCLIVAQVGISGSTRIGAGVIFAGQSGAAGHLNIGAGSVIASKTAVYHDLPEGSRVAGIPAIDMGVWRKAQAVFRRLPELRSRLLGAGTAEEKDQSGKGHPPNGPAKRRKNA